MNGWWRRNRVALVALVVLLPLTAGVVGGWEWWKRAQGDTVFPVTAAAGETVELAGISFGPAAAREISIPGEELPPGTKVVSVSVTVDRDGGATPCSRPLLHELHGEGRTWGDDATTVTWESAGFAFCPSDPEDESFPDGPFTIEVPYVVPDDVAGPLAVEFTVANELPRYVRLVVAP